ncbi:MAG TPA: hypothetical protein VHW24_27785 [Bryobacteraceae bacterium]|nr:hypothetical protein [Bryobacteraceae bacterium]
MRKHHVKLAVAGLLFMQHGNASKGLASSPYQFTNPILQIPDISGSNNFVIVHLCLLLACGFENPRVAALNQIRRAVHLQAARQLAGALAVLLMNSTA